MTLNRGGHDNVSWHLLEPMACQALSSADQTHDSPVKGGLPFPSQAHEATEAA